VEPGSVTWLAVDTDGAAVGLDDRLDDGQSQAGARICL